MSVTPAQSTVSYKCVVNDRLIENTNDSVQWDVTDAALSNATVMATATIGSVVYYNGEPVSAVGIQVDVTNPVTLEARDDAGNTRVYTLKVVRATTAGNEDMKIKSSVFNGFPAKESIVDYDMAYFNGKFYAIVTSVSGDMENYQLFSSLDGLTWQEVAYQTTTAGVVLPEGQTGYVIGGEGARLAVFKDKMYVLGGARTKGADKFGNAAEVSDGWFGPTPSLDEWRSYSTSDGVTFSCDTVGMKYINGDAEQPKRWLATTDMEVAVLNGRLYMKSGIQYGYGMAQTSGIYAYTENGKDWVASRPMVEGSEPSVGVAYTRGDAFFAFKGKLWMIGGFKSFASANNMTSAVYSSADGNVWTEEGRLPENMSGMMGMKVVANDHVAYMFGGQNVVETENGNVFAPQMFRSEDGVNWEPVEVPASFTARRRARVVLQENAAWLFGGITSLNTNSYAYLADGDVWTYDTWVKLIK